MPEPESRQLFTERQIRNAFTATIVGMVGVLVAILLLATSRPQGALQPADDSAYRASLTEATENLGGYERVGEDRAKVDIDHAMRLVAERGVNLALTEVTAAAPAADGAADGDTAAADGAGDAAQAAPSDVDGAAVFAANCVACHQANGQGIPGAFPPLANDHALDLATADGGRDYLVRVLLYGLQGQIEVNGATYNGLMPAWQQLSDAELAAVLNHIVTAWSDAPEFTPFTPEAFAAARGEGLSGADVLEARPDLP